MGQDSRTSSCIFLPKTNSLVCGDPKVTSEVVVRLPRTKAICCKSYRKPKIGTLGERTLTQQSRLGWIPSSGAKQYTCNIHLENQQRSQVVIASRSWWQCGITGYSSDSMPLGKLQESSTTSLSDFGSAIVRRNVCLKQTDSDLLCTKNMVPYIFGKFHSFSSQQTRRSKEAS